MAFWSSRLTAIDWLQRWKTCPTALRSPPSGLKLPQRYVLDHVACSLLQDEVGALPRRQDVLVQIDEVDAIPDRGRGVRRFLVAQAGIAVEERFRIAERGLAKRQEAVDVPALEHALVGI